MLCGIFFANPLITLSIGTFFFFYNIILKTFPILYTLSFILNIILYPHTSLNLYKNKYVQFKVSSSKILEEISIQKVLQFLQYFYFILYYTSDMLTVACQGLGMLHTGQKQIGAITHHYQIDIGVKMSTFAFCIKLETHWVHCTYC